MDKVLVKHGYGSMVQLIAWIRHLLRGTAMQHVVQCHSRLCAGGSCLLQTYYYYSYLLFLPTQDILKTCVQGVPSYSSMSARLHDILCCLAFVYGPINAQWAAFNMGLNYNTVREA